MPLTAAQSATFYEQDNLIHTCGVEMSPYNRLTVSDVDTDEDVFGCNLDEVWIKDNAWVINDVEPTLCDDTGLIHTVSVEKGYWEYESFTTEQPFDHKKLEFFMHAIDGLYVIHYMKYEGIELGHLDGTTLGKEFQVLFDWTGVPPDFLISFFKHRRNTARLRWADCLVIGTVVSH